MSDLHKAFLSSLENYPSQDNEGYNPDRAGFKCGFYEGYRFSELKISQLEKENAELKTKLAHVERELEEEIKALEFYANRSTYRYYKWRNIPSDIELDEFGGCARQRIKERREFNEHD